MKSEAKLCMTEETKLLRDHFAGLAMQAFIASGRFQGYEDCAGDACGMADAMLKALEAE